MDAVSRARDFFFDGSVDTEPDATEEAARYTIPCQDDFQILSAGCHLYLLSWYVRSGGDISPAGGFCKKISGMGGHLLDMRCLSRYS